MVTWSQEELDAKRALIAAGKEAPDAIQKHLAEEEENVFGKGFKRDRDGNPIEQGIGSASQPTRNSIEAYKTHQLTRRGGPEEGYQEHLARMESDLAKFEQRKATERAARKTARV